MLISAGIFQWIGGWRSPARRDRLTPSGRNGFEERSFPAGRKAFAAAVFAEGRFHKRIGKELAKGGGPNRRPMPWEVEALRHIVSPTDYGVAADL